MRRLLQSLLLLAASTLPGSYFELRGSKCMAQPPGSFSGLSLVRAIDNPAKSPMGDFGRSLSVSPSGDRIAIGADLDDDAAKDSGAIYLYDANFDLLNKITHPDDIVNGNMGMTLGWTTDEQLIAGAWTPFIDAPVYVFDRAGNLELRIENPLPKGRGQFGIAATAIGNDFLLGSGFEDDAIAEAGAVYLYDSQGSMVRRFVSPAQTDGNGAFGRSVESLGRTRFVVGAYAERHGAIDSGQAYVFSTDGTLISTLVNPAPMSRAYFGINVAKAGNDIVVGSIHDNNNAQDGGESYLFSQTGELLTTFINPRPSPRDWFGYSNTSIGKNGEYVVVGAPFEEKTGILGGAAYVYDKQGNLLQELNDPTPGDAGGFSLVYGYGDTLYIAAPYDGAGPGVQGPGAVYIYNLNLLSGDVNMDSRVNLDDFISLRKHFGQDVNARADGDLTGDLKVDLADFIQLRANFGKVAPVPEPGGVALTLLTAGGLAWMGLRGRTWCIMQLASGEQVGSLH